MTAFNQKYRKEYIVWRAMMTRCYNEDDVCYDIYGGRGIKVCKRWHQFKNFVDDMAPRPDGYQLDRCNNDKGYRPGNCRWVTPKVNANNRSNSPLIIHEGRKWTTRELAEQVGLKVGLLSSKLSRGWSVEEAISRSPNRCDGYAKRK